METPVEPDDIAAASQSLQSYGAVVDLVSERYETGSLLGALLIDGSFLHDIELRNGSAARVKSLQVLGELVRTVGRSRLDLNDLVVTGEVGRNEVLVLFFRDGGDVHFYRDEIPSYAQALRQLIQRHGGKSFYPYLRNPPSITTGHAVCIRNPKFSAETQLRKVVEEAREDRELNQRLEARSSRRRFVETVLDQGVYSVYEPIVEVTSKTVFGYESLVRGPVGSEFESPLMLFRAADEQDMVFELDCLCRASGLRGAIDFPSGSKLFLNVLPTAIHDPNFRAERLIKTLAECSLTPSDVVLEISEQESIESFSDFKEVRDYYRQLGFQFALDDTGSGYAGLEALLEISPEFIKMDRAFVSGVDQDPSRQHMLAALLEVAEGMGAKIIGEGLDTLEELDMLGELGIHYGQGWLFGKPTPLRARE
jgi:EAL domain-containing protein (putative c-di-GMP-specific phosphodiesterase class I)